MLIRKLTILLLLSLLGGCLGARPGPSVQGKVNFERLPASGVVVEAYRADGVHLGDKPDFRSAATTADGRFRLSLAPGRYYLFARGEGLYAYYGRNPLLVSEEGLADLSIGLVRLDQQPQTDEQTDFISGRVIHAGAGQADAVIFVYTDLTSQLKGMGYMMAGPTDEQGRFELNLPDGTYYLLARKRQGNTAVGPLRAGDFIGYYPQNPLRVRGGTAAPITIPVLEVPDKVQQLAGSMFGQTAISGVIRDAAGAPVAGARVVLYTRPQMLDRPLLVSQPTGADGRYTLSMPQGGVYYLAARNTLGGAPGPGDLYGTYDANPDHKLKIETGDSRDGVDIVVEEMW